MTERGWIILNKRARAHVWLKTEKIERLKRFSEMPEMDASDHIESLLADLAEAKALLREAANILEVCLVSGGPHGCTDRLVKRIRAVPGVVEADKP